MSFYDGAGCGSPDGGVFGDVGGDGTNGSSPWHAVGVDDAGGGDVDAVAFAQGGADVEPVAAHDHVGADGAFDGDLGGSVPVGDLDEVNVFTGALEYKIFGDAVVAADEGPNSFGAQIR